MDVDVKELIEVARYCKTRMACSGCPEYRTNCIGKQGVVDVVVEVADYYAAREKAIFDGLRECVEQKQRVCPSQNTDVNNGHYSAYREMELKLNELEVEYGR